MSEVFFVLKTLVIAIAVVFLMQIKVGNKTVETRALTFIDESVAVDGLRYIAEGAMSVAGRGWETLVKTVSGESPSAAASNSTDASRGGGNGSKSRYSWEIKRSEAYKKQQAKRRETAEQERRARVDGPTGDEVD